jgi:hypothetical protein
MKFLYIIDYWVPDYVGVINLIAETDKNAFNIIKNKTFVESVGEYYTDLKCDYDYEEKYKIDIARNIIKAQRFPLLPSNPGFKSFYSGIVYFISHKK